MNKEEQKNVTEEQKNVTLDDFVNKSLEVLRNRKNVEFIEVEGFGKIPFNRPTDNQLLSYLNASSKGAVLGEDGKAKMVDMTPIALASKTLVYQSCQYLHNKQLLEDAEVDEPDDIAFKIFGLSGTMDIAGKISDVFGSNEVVNKVKN